MNTTEKELVPGFRRSHMASVKGNRTRHVVTFNPMSNSQRLDMVEYRIAGENLRKLISKDDSVAKSGKTQKVSDALMLST